MSKKLIALLMCAAMLLALAAGCGNDAVEPDASGDSNTPVTDPAAPSAPAEEVNKIHYDYLTTEIPSLNGMNEVNESSDTPIQWCNSSLYRAVPGEDRKSYYYVPDLAAGMPEQVDDYTWRVTIREDAKWHNGEPINADTLMFTYKTILDPKLVNSMATFMADSNITIVNATAYMMQGTEDYPDAMAWEDVGIKKIDDMTIEFQVESVVTENAFCTHFTNRANFPIYEPLWNECLSDDGTTTSYGSSLDTWMGCGPYKFTNWEYDSMHVYEKNEDHWLADYFNFDEVQIRIVPEMNARLQLFESNQMDNLSPDSNTIETYIDDPRLVSNASLSVTHYEVNTLNPNNPIAASLNYRKAIYHALNREVIAEDVLGNLEPYGIYVNGQAGILSDSGQTYRESEYGKAVYDMVESWGPYGYNPELAREYLAKAYEECGVPEDTVITLTILYSDASDTGAKMCEYLMEELPVIFEGKIKCEPNVVASGMAWDYKYNEPDKWDLTHDDWSRSLSRTLPYQCFYYYTSGYSGGPTTFHVEAYDQQFDACEAVREGDYETILQATQKMEEVYLENLLTIPVCHNVSYTLFSERLELPMDTYVPGFGWGMMFADIAE